MGFLSADLQSRSIANIWKITCIVSDLPLLIVIIVGWKLFSITIFDCSLLLTIILFFFVLGYIGVIPRFCCVCVIVVCDVVANMFMNMDMNANMDENVDKHAHSYRHSHEYIHSHSCDCCLFFHPFTSSEFIFCNRTSTYLICGIVGRFYWFCIFNVLAVMEFFRWHARQCHYIRNVLCVVSSLSRLATVTFLLLLLLLLLSHIFLRRFSERRNLRIVWNSSLLTSIMLFTTCCSKCCFSYFYSLYVCYLRLDMTHSLFLSKR